jgi:uncharacterized protein (DUF58 family)
MKMRLDEPVRGAVLDPADLIATRFLARHIDVTRSTRALAHLAGAKRSARRGRGVEFDEVRQYAAGDDVRAIDWRVTARSGEAHTKLFHEERERPVLTTVDLRQPMHFGSRSCFKSVLAAHVATTLLWSALDRGERIGAMVYSGYDVLDVRPARSRRSVLKLIGDMEALAQRRPDDSGYLSFAEHVNQLQRIARPGSSVFLISDFHDSHAPEVMENLRRLARHVQITAIAISDPLEADLPEAGRYVVADASGRSALDTASDTARQRYRDDFAAHRKALTQQLQSLRIPVIELSTAQAPLPVLQRYFPGR